MKNRLKLYLTARQKNNAERLVANRHNLDTLHVLREEASCLDALSDLVDAMPDERALHATTERDEQDRARERVAAEVAARKRTVAQEKRARSAL